MWRKLRKILIWTFSIVVGLVLTLAFVIWLMQDKIKAYAVSYLNDHLKTELKVEQIDVTFLTTFPNVGLHFKNTVILDPEGLQTYRDTLLSAKHIYLKFGLWDVLASDYKAKQLDVYDAHIRAFINKDGIENYDILKPSKEKKGESDALVLDLSKIKLYNTRLTYHNAKGNQQYKFRTNELHFNGKLGSDIFDLKTSGDLRIISLRNKNLVLFKNQDSGIDLILSVDTKNQRVTFTQGDWQIGKMLLGIKGKIDILDEGNKCDINIFGKNISIVSIMQLMSDKVRQNMERYKSFGTVNLDASIKGIVGKTEAPDVNASFSISNGVLVEKKSNISLHNIDLAGNYTNRNKRGIDELNIEKMHGRFKDGRFELDGKLTDFEQPHFIVNVKGNFTLQTIHGFMSSETVKEMKGDVSLNSRLDFVLLRTDDLLLTNTLVNEASGTVKFANATVLINEKGKPITDLNGQLNLKDNDALVDGLQGKIGKSDFSINGAIRNFTPYFLTGNQDLSVVGAFHADFCDINDLVTKTTETSVDKSGAEIAQTGYSFPEKINFNFDLNINKLEWDPFTSENVRGNFKLIDNKLSASNLNIDFAGGKCTGYIDVEEKEGKGFAATASTKIENVQLPLALKAFKNFGQDLITPANSKGVLTATVEWFFPINSDLKIEPGKMLANASVSIKNGQLTELNQLKQLAGFMRTDKKMKLFLKKHADDFEQRIRNLKFDELKNELTVKEGVLTIPKMLVSSSAMNLNFAGTHTFENKIDYHFNFRFLELKGQDYESEFGEIKDDGTGIKVYMHMFGDLDNPQYAWDKEEKKAERQEQWQKEKETFKSLLKEELGLFKKDTTIKVEKAKEEDVKFIMEWDEADPLKKDESQPVKDNKKVKKLKKKLGIDENPNKDVKFEIEQ
ncbi:MAG TPA: AsmA-like C-terminal region-containing protein [Flavobacteriales bacterium]|nr:AsmA-like C-terminal region-containing protein [Flavobacteriales bacterium]